MYFKALSGNTCSLVRTDKGTDSLTQCFWENRPSKEDVDEFNDWYMSQPEQSNAKLVGTGVETPTRSENRRTALLQGKGLFGGDRA